jgi:large subunit ribosomal protein L35
LASVGRTPKHSLYWLLTLIPRPNIPVSSTSTSPISLSDEASSALWIPPHPQKGTPYHRYCVFLLEHPEPNKRVEIEPIDQEGRNSFILRDFVARWGFKPQTGGGAHFWRSIWDPEVSEIYKKIIGGKVSFLKGHWANLVLDTSEPIYGHPPKVGRYDELKNTRKYI